MWTLTTSAAAIAPVLLVLVSSLVAAAASAPAIGLPGCNTTCGGVEVPYPFGMGPARCCHSPEFKLTCDDPNNSASPRLLLGDGIDSTLQVDYIDLGKPFLLVNRTAGGIKLGRDGRGWFGRGLSWPYVLAAGAFGGGNELIVTGCNVRATLRDGNNATISGCSSFCVDDGDDFDGPSLQYVSSRLDSSMLCTGMACCQAPIVVNSEEQAKRHNPPVYSASNYHVEVEWFGSNRSADEARMPTRVFVANVGWFENKRAADPLLKFPFKDAVQFPVSLDWVLVGHGAAAADSNTQYCYNGTRGGYKCLCKEGYRGNPYIAQGCTRKVTIAGEETTARAAECHVFVTKFGDSQSRMTSRYDIC